MVVGRLKSPGTELPLPDPKLVTNVPFISNF
jgi:hypothetical protein